MYYWFPDGIVFLFSCSHPSSQRGWSYCRNPHPCHPANTTYPIPHQHHAGARTGSIDRPRHVVVVMVRARQLVVQMDPCLCCAHSCRLPPAAAAAYVGDQAVTGTEDWAGTRAVHCWSDPSSAPVHLRAPFVRFVPPLFHPFIQFMRAANRPSDWSCRADMHVYLILSFGHPSSFSALPCPSSCLPSRSWSNPRVWV